MRLLRLGVQDGGCGWWLRAEAENGRGREWGLARRVEEEEGGLGGQQDARPTEVGGVGWVRAEGVGLDEGKTGEEEKPLIGGPWLLC
jgi:hypothetical protein